MNQIIIGPEKEVENPAAVCKTVSQFDLLVQLLSVAHVRGEVRSVAAGAEAAAAAAA